MRLIDADVFIGELKKECSKAEIGDIPTAFVKVDELVSVAYYKKGIEMAARIAASMARMRTDAGDVTDGSEWYDWRDELEREWNRETDETD